MTLTALCLLAGCATTTREVPTVPEGGMRIYAGEVHAAAGTHLFHYTRSSIDRGRGWTSVHRSYDATTDDLLVAQAADHDAAYVLHRYVEHHQQLGIRSLVTAPDAEHLAYTSVRGARTRHRTERIDAPAVTGPTLFGFVRTHWDRLERGESIVIRFVVAERRRSYPFVLRMSPPANGRTTVQMRPRAPLLRLTIPPMHMRFDTQTRTILEYEGRVPPRHEGQPVDGRVHYRHASNFR